MQKSIQTDRVREIGRDTEIHTKREIERNGEIIVLAWTLCTIKHSSQINSACLDLMLFIF